MTASLHTRDVGQGTPLVLLHAFPLSSAMWLGQREALRDSYRLITPDLRGFGGSVLGQEEPSIDAMAEDVARLLRAKRIERAVICGLSMGGYVAMALCRNAPDLLLGLVLAGTRASADSPQARADRLAMAVQLESGGTAQPLVDQLLPKLLGPTTLRQRAMAYGRVRGLMQAAPPRAAAWAQRAMADRPDSFGTLRETNVPALVIAGEEDAITSETDARLMCQALPRAEFILLPKSGHLSPIEQPDLFNKALADFAARLS